MCIRKFFILVSFMSILAGFAYSEEDSLKSPESINGNANALGIGGTVYRTWGFNYRRHFESNLGISVNIGGWLTPNWGYLGSSFGLLYSLAHHKFHSQSLPHSSVRIYLIAYCVGILHGYSDGSYNPSNNSKSISNFPLDFGGGIGPGAEFFFNQHFALNIELPWMSLFNTDYQTVSFLSSYPHFGGSLSYYF
jgi:hypothetical protein